MSFDPEDDMSRKQAKQPLASELAAMHRKLAETHRQKAAGYPETTNENWRKFHLKQADAAERTAERFEREAEKPKNSTT